MSSSLYSDPNEYVDLKIGTPMFFFVCFSARTRIV